MAANKQYLDENGLSLFWSNVKSYYSSNALNPKMVDNAHDAINANLAEAAEKLDEGRYVKLTGDASGKVLFDGSQNVSIATTIDISAIEDHEILKLFGNKVNASSFESTADAIEAAGNGGTITVNNQDAANAMITDPMTYGSGAQAALHVEGNTDITVEIPEGVVLDVSAAGFRGFDVRDGATLELRGKGTVKSSGDTPTVFLGKNANLIIDGITLDNADGSYNISTNGNNSGSNVWIKSGTFKGPCYFPARGTLRIDGGTFTNAHGTVLYVKNGSPTIITGGTFEVTGLDTSKDTVPGRPENAWAHNNNGIYGTGSAVIIEACNYGGHGNPAVSITGGTFINKTTPEMQGESWPILVIDYMGNAADMSGTMLPYQYAIMNEAHVSSNTGIPSDGWVFFGDDNTPTSPIEF